jgi:predicted nucleic acid-binding protein
VTEVECQKSDSLVLDAMCLNHFARVDRLDVLSDLLSGEECLTTYVVLDELRAGVDEHPSLKSALQLEWISVIPLDTIGELERFATWVSRIGAGARDRGEASVFAVAEERHAVAITDDQAATRVARRFGLEVHGTIWLLGRACRTGKLTMTAASNLVEMLRETGMRLPCTGPEFPSWAGKRGLL